MRLSRERPQASSSSCPRTRAERQPQPSAGGKRAGPPGAGAGGGLNSSLSAPALDNMFAPVPAAIKPSSHSLPNSSGGQPVATTASTPLQPRPGPASSTSPPPLSPRQPPTSSFAFARPETSSVVDRRPQSVFASATLRVHPFISTMGNTAAKLSAGAGSGGDRPFSPRNTFFDMRAPAPPSSFPAGTGGNASNAVTSPNASAGPSGHAQLSSAQPSSLPQPNNTTPSTTPAITTKPAPAPTHSRSLSKDPPEQPRRALGLVRKISFRSRERRQGLTANTPARASTDPTGLPAPPEVLLHDGPATATATGAVGKLARASSVGHAPAPPRPPRSGRRSAQPALATVTPGVASGPRSQTVQVAPAQTPSPRKGAPAPLMPNHVGQGSAHPLVAQRSSTFEVDDTSDPRDAHHASGAAEAWRAKVAALTGPYPPSPSGSTEVLPRPLPPPRRAQRLPEPPLSAPLTGPNTQTDIDRRPIELQRSWENLKTSQAGSIVSPAVSAFGSLIGGGRRRHAPSMHRSMSASSMWDNASLVSKTSTPAPTLLSVAEVDRPPLASTSQGALSPVETLAFGMANQALSSPVETFGSRRSQLPSVADSDNYQQPPAPEPREVEMVSSSRAVPSMEQRLVTSSRRTRKAPPPSPVETLAFGMTSRREKRDADGADSGEGLPPSPRPEKRAFANEAARILNAEAVTPKASDRAPWHSELHGLGIKGVPAESRTVSHTVSVPDLQYEPRSSSLSANRRGMSNGLSLDFVSQRRYQAGHPSMESPPASTPTTSSCDKPELLTPTVVLSAAEWHGSPSEWPGSPAPEAVLGPPMSLHMNVPLNVDENGHDCDADVSDNIQMRERRQSRAQRDSITRPPLESCYMSEETHDTYLKPEVVLNEGALGNDHALPNDMFDLNVGGAHANDFAAKDYAAVHAKDFETGDDARSHKLREHYNLTPGLDTGRRPRKTGLPRDELRRWLLQTAATATTAVA